MFFFTTLMLAASALALPAKNPLPAKISLMHEGRAAAAIYTQCTRPNTVALTWDDGPYEWTKEIVDTLDAHKAKGTFFLNGNNFQCIYSPTNVANIKAAHASGHEIASHTWSHHDLAKLSKTAIASEFELLDLALERIIGVRPRLVRPPFGSYNALVEEVAAERGQIIAMWNLDSGDSKGGDALSAQGVYSDAATSRPASIVALNHETYAHSARSTLVHALQVLGSAGYSFTTMSECIGVTPYTLVTTPQTGSWSC